MHKRLLLGPLMIALLVAGVALDQVLDRQPLPAALGGREGRTWPPGSLLTVICLAVAVAAARELAGLLKDKGIEASKRVMTFAAVLGLLVSCMVPHAAGATAAVALVSTAAVAVLSFAMVFYSRRKTVEGVIASTGGALLSFVYLGLMFGFLLAIRREFTAWTLLWVLFVTKSCDTGAYFTGRAIGRHKLIPWLSPGKTWEGLAGGLLASGLIALVAGGMLPNVRPGVGRIGLVGIGMLLGLAGQAGDLLESIIKRDAGAKDSGKTIPGFGGVLDVLDSPLLAAPLAFWWLRAAQHNGWIDAG